MNAIDLLCAAHARLTWLLDEHLLLPRAAHDAGVATMDRFRADLAIHRPVATYPLLLHR